MTGKKTTEAKDKGVSDRMTRSVAAIKNKFAGNIPDSVLVLGSGLGDFVEAMEIDEAISYADIADFPAPTVEGHAGRLIFGRAGGVPLLCLQGRVHAYEGHQAAQLAVSVRTAHALGCKNIILTNAAGSLNADMGPGSLMLIEDHINWAGVNPLIGPNDNSLGPRFPDMSEVYDRDLRRGLLKAAEGEGVKLFSGVYVMTMGPSFETPAEIRAFKTLGADAVGMSTVPEALVANYCGMRVAGISMISNMAAGLGQGKDKGKITHQETIEQGSEAAAALARILPSFLGDIEGGS
jgi:purine-nucleoside phosphorylase